MAQKKERRFQIREEEGLGFGAVQIVVDTQTGVHYILASGVGGLSITPLLDRDGNVIAEDK